MKNKILVVVLLFLFLSPLFMANVQAAQLPFLSVRNSLRNNSSQDKSSQDNSSQQRAWLSWRNPTSQNGSDSQKTYAQQWLNFPLSGNEAYLQWIREQIDTVLGQLQQKGITLPGDIDQKLNNFFATASDYLTQTQNQGSLPSLSLPGLLTGPGYNLSCNYDPKNQIMYFKANRVLGSGNSLTSSENSLTSSETSDTSSANSDNLSENNDTSIDLDGSFSPDGTWNMAFAIVSSIVNRDRGSQRKAYFQKALSSLNSSSTDTSNTNISSASQTDTSKDPQQPDNKSTRKANHRSGLTFSGEICQDGLVSLHLNPSQIINLKFMNSASYAAVTGVDIVQDAGSRTGKLYMDILDNSVSGTDGDNSIYHWEAPLW
jgi:hypothetical protein